MFSSPISNRPIQAQTAPADVSDIAESLWHLSLKIPAGPARKNGAAIRIVAAAIDEVLASALDDAQDKTIQLQALMQELTGSTASDADMRDASGLEKAFPDIRLVIGKISLLYHQALSSMAASKAGDDIVAPSQAASESPLSDASSRLRSSFSPQPSIVDTAVRVSSPQQLASKAATVPAQNLASGSAQSPGFLAKPSPARCAPPIPQHKPQLPSALPQASVMLAAQQAHASDAAGVHVETTDALPISLKRCLALLESDALYDVDDAAACFVCPQTSQIWSDPVIDMRDGRSYERSHLPIGVPLHHVRPNDAARAFIEVWRTHMHDNPTAFAARLKACVQKDGSHKPIYDPVVARGTGAVYSAQALVHFATQRYPSAVIASLLTGESYCVNRLLVRMMRHFNLGVPDAGLINPARFWPHSAASQAPLEDAALSQSVAAHHPHISCYGQHMQGLWQLLALTGCETELARYQTELDAILVGHAHVLLSGNSPNYPEAFNAGLNIHALIYNITVLLELAQGESLLAGLRIMRADCFSILGDGQQTRIDLQDAELMWPPSLMRWGRKETLEQLRRDA